MSELQALKDEFMGGGLPAMTFAGVVVVTLIIGLITPAGGLAIFAMGLLATIAVEAFGSDGSEPADDHKRLPSS